jgi:hypothetical protein
MMPARGDVSTTCSLREAETRFRTADLGLRGRVVDSLRGVPDTEPVASKFMLIFRGGAVSRGDLSPTELQAHVAKWYTWSDELTRQGRRIVGTPLDNPGVTVRGHERMVTDGPYAESKDLVTGSMIIEAASIEDALEVARTCPTYEFDGSVEVRPVQEHRL